MIRLHQVTKSYATRHGAHQVLRGVDVTIERGEKVGILGRNGAGKSTLVRIIGGVEQPTTGSVEHSMSISWPLAFGGAFQGSLTGMDNLRFICRVYGVSIRDKLAFVEDFTELGKFLKEPVKTYSSGMRAKLAFAISIVIDFDCYLIDEVMAVGDPKFQAKCNQELFNKRSEKSFVIVSHVIKNIRENCDRALVLHNGRLLEFSDIDDAISYYRAEF